MKDIKELADQIGAEVWPDTVRCITDLRDFAQRLIAAYGEGREPAAYVRYEVQRPPTFVPVTNGKCEVSAPVSYNECVPLYAAPPLTEPAPAVDPHWPKINMDISEKNAATTPEEAQEMVSELLAITETINRGHHAADHYDAIAISCAADMIERLAAVNTNLNSENALLLKWKLEGVPEGCVVVPREPTKGMVAASWHAAGSVRFDDGQEKYIAVAYQAMIAAGEVK